MQGRGRDVQGRVEAGMNSGLSPVWRKKLIRRMSRIKLAVRSACIHGRW